MNAHTICVEHVEDFINAGFDLLDGSSLGHPLDSGIRVFCPHEEEVSS